MGFFKYIYIKFSIMGQVNTILDKISDYLISINRNTGGGWYELTIGLPITWAFKDSPDVSCVVINETNTGRLILIKPNFIDVNVDDLIDFVLLIINTNKKISEKEEEFKRKIEDIKNNLEDELKKHNLELEKLKKSSFIELNNSETATVSTETSLTDSENQPQKRQYKTRKQTNIENE